MIIAYYAHFRGYLGDEVLNDQKFLMNWFVDNEKWVEMDKNKSLDNQPWRRYYKGPRDRLYRTGDLGRYLESGDVECTGRADDQVCLQLLHHLSVVLLNNAEC